MNNSTKIGGPNLTVEIDESLFTRRKNNTGRIFHSQWVFGGMCRETLDVFMVMVPNRSADTLIPIIEDHIASDPDTGAHTQNIERLWRSAKERNKKHSGTHRSMLDSYISELLWRQKHKKNHLNCPISVFNIGNFLSKCVRCSTFSAFYDLTFLKT
ncbi:DDE Tnp IS1595 domain-containing protein [Aphis craccivora]|uniref:DDE Tnp IS1595 domain-containing protein n=1 Tax=Aphis craccivora TaxID=307492 RepID=A0A6G0YKH0_APHCR|nr:DDE Tnp IS1595 domain-containing protein [Aphis craccivora]